MTVALTSNVAKANNIPARYETGRGLDPTPSLLRICWLRIGPLHGTERIGAFGGSSAKLQLPVAMRWITCTTNSTQAKGT